MLRKIIYIYIYIYILCFLLCFSACPSTNKFVEPQWTFLPSLVMLTGLGHIWITVHILGDFCEVVKYIREQRIQKEGNRKWEMQDIICHDLPTGPSVFYLLTWHKSNPTEKFK
jgi:hypothetical protein